MALRFMDSFDHYATAEVTRKYSAINGGPEILPTGGRNGGGCLYKLPAASTYVQQTLDSQATWIVGFAAKIDRIPPSESIILAFMDGATHHCDLRVTTANQIRVTRNGTALATSTNTLAIDTWYFIEIKVTIADSGTYEVRVNGTSTGWIPSASGDTRNAATATANTFRLLQVRNVSAIHATYIDDLYVCDGTGSANNDFLGDVMVHCLYPSGAGTTTQWAPSAGSNYQNVDDASVDDDTTYNSSATDGHIDLYALGDLPYTPDSIFGVQWNAQVRKDDASTYELNRIIRSGGTNYEGSTALSPSESYTNYTEIMETDPATTAAWTKSGVDALEAGIKLETVV